MNHPDRASALPSPRPSSSQRSRKRKQALELVLLWHGASDDQEVLPPSASHWEGSWIVSASALGGKTDLVARSPGLTGMAQREKL